MMEMEHQGVQLVTGTEGPLKSSSPDVVDHQYRPGTTEEQLADEARIAEVRRKWHNVASTSKVVRRLQRRTSPVGDNPSSNPEGTRVLGDMDSGGVTSSGNDVDLIDWGDSAPSAPTTNRTGQKPAEANGVADPETVVCEQVPSFQPWLDLMDNDVYNIDFSEPQAGHGDASQTEGVMNGTENVAVSQHQDMTRGLESAGVMNCTESVAVSQHQDMTRGLESAGVISLENVVVTPGEKSHFRSLSLLGFSGRKPTEEANSSEGGSLKDGEKGSPAVRTYSRAFSKVLHGRRKTAEPDAALAKPVHKPLLTKFEEERQEHKARKEAKKEAERDVEREARALCALANPTPQSMMDVKEPDFIKKATKGVAKLFLPKGVSKGYKEPEVTVDTREAKVLMGRTKALLSDLMGPSQAAVALAPIQTAPRYSPKPQDIHFETVESNQRDVPAWTREEYMARNARLGEWNKRETDEDYGTIEGSLFGNQFTDGFDDDLDSDDSD